MTRSHPETWLITENRGRRFTGDQEQCFWIGTEHRGRQYWLRRTKDVRPGQVKMESMKEKDEA